MVNRSREALNPESLNRSDVVGMMRTRQAELDQVSRRLGYSVMWTIHEGNGEIVTLIGRTGNRKPKGGH